MDRRFVKIREFIMKKLLFVSAILFIILSLAGATNAFAAREEPIIYNSGNTAAVAPVKEGAGTPPSFTLKEKYYFITTILNYHWNDGKGAGGQGTVTLVDEKGNTVGSWESHRPAWEPADKDYWFEINPKMMLAPGRYTVRDSNPATWAWNEGTGGAGMSIVKGFEIFECLMEEKKPVGFQLFPVVWAKDSGARFSSLTRDVEVFPDADPTTQKTVKLDMPLYIEDHIRTGEDSGAIISFSDLTTFCLKAESEVVLVTPPEKDSKVRLVLGNIWVNAKKMLKDGSLNIDMTQAVAGTKGTQFIAETTADRSAIQVIEGAVEFTAKSDGKKIIVSAGEEVGATKDGLEEKTSMDPQVLAYYKTLPEKIEGESVELSPTRESKSASEDETTTTAPAELSPALSSPLVIGIIILGVLVAGVAIILKIIKKKQ